MPRFGPFELETDRRQLSREGTLLHLTPKAFDLLKLLIDAAPRVVTKAELHASLWPQTFVADTTLVGLVKEIRRALDDRDPQAPLIRTVHRVGYAFCAALQAAPDRASGICGWLLRGERRFPVVAGESILGRDPSSDIWLDHATVSRRHARIVADAAAVRVQDLGSKNGTLVGERDAVELLRLADGDRVLCGQVVLIFRAAGRSPATVSQVTRRGSLETPA